MSQEIVSRAIHKFISEEIALSKRDISAAVKSREWFLQRVENQIAKRSNEPVLHPMKFLKFGSYFKQTKVSDVDEFDIMVIIDSNNGRFFSGDKTIGTGLGNANPNTKYTNPNIRKDDGYISPNKILNWLKGIVTEVTDAFEGQAPERDGQAITAIIKSKDLKIDLVPAGIFEDANGEVFFTIPKGDKNNNWIQTAPDRDMKLLESIAQNKDSFRNVIRLIKYIKSKYNFKISSYALEHAIVKFAETNKWEGNIYYNLYNTILFIIGRLRVGSLEEPFNNVNLLEGVGSKDYYISRFKKINERLDALEEEEDEEIVYEKVTEIFKNL
ncbi:hypothetical protein [Paenibacillus sp. NPDC058174]|uniref:hypothetical protein n=1 Tax=Paenibacillus sp. NPDC058174 TaxID=3346366 RepID=UPI0036DF02BB